ncbi:MAG: PTS IIA-like nitrogen regulatory protein PtsN [Gammaproteobacteria bacterium]
MKVSEILAPERVAIDAELASKKAVLEKLAEMLASADPDLKPAAVFESLLARERLGTTGLGAGIAIPHGRVSTQQRSIGAFLRTGEPIGFDAVDNAPVDLFFALCVPEDATQEHLELLSGLASRFSDGDFVTALRSSDRADEVFRQLVDGAAGEP